MTEDELAEAANTIYDQLADLQPAPNNLRKAANIGCQILQGLAEDPDFFGQINYLRNLRTEYQNEYSVITGSSTASLDHFTYFLDSERKLMLLGGLRPDLTEAIIGQAMGLIQDIRRGNLDSQRLRVTLRVLRHKTCDLAQKLNDQFQVRENSRIIQNRLTGIAYGMGGAAMIFINAAPPIIADRTLAPADMAVSGAFGAVILDKAWDLVRHN